MAPGVPGFSPIPLPRNPAPNTVITTGVGGLTVTLNKQVSTAGVLEVTGIYITAGAQDLSLAVSTCGITVGGPRR